MARPWPTHTEARVLELLAATGEAYGLELVGLSGGWLKRGTVYVLLDRMREKGLVADRQEQTSVGIPRRSYRLTGFGAAVLAAWEIRPPV